MSGSDADAPPPPPPLPQSQTPVVAQSPHTMSTIKLPILKKGEYDVWAMKMEHYLAHTDYPLWEVIQKVNGPMNVSTDTHGIMKVLPPKTAEETLAREREEMQGLLYPCFTKRSSSKGVTSDDANEMWEAIKSRFGGNEESKKNKANDNSKRLGKKEESNALMTLDGGCVDWTSHSEDEMAKQAELNNRMRKKSSQREIRPIWNNVQRVNHKNQFVPTAAKLPNYAAMKVNIVKPIVNNARPKGDFRKSVSPFRKSFNRTTTLRTNFSKQKVNTAEVNAVSAVRGKRETTVKPSLAITLSRLQRSVQFGTHKSGEDDPNNVNP
ncbi:hypothetical protein Tco_0537179, partial [Tanacetum coccineum]